MDWLLQTLERQLKNPFGFFVVIMSGIITVASTTITAIGVINKITPPWNLVFGFSIFAVVPVVILIFVFAFSFRKTYRLPLTERFIFLDVIQHWHFMANGLRKVKVKKMYVFYKPPAQEDLFDTIIGSLELDFHALKYNSPDSKVIETEKVGEFLYKILWQPKNGEIKIGEPYMHKLECLYPKGDDSLNKSITVASTVYVKKVKVIITSEREINEIVAYKKRAFQSYKKYPRIQNLAEKIRDYKSPPVNRVSPKKAEWEISDLYSGETYFINIKFSENIT